MQLLQVRLPLTQVQPLEEEEEEVEEDPLEEEELEDVEEEPPEEELEEEATQVSKEALQAVVLPETQQVGVLLTHETTRGEGQEGI